jgi:membrane fusion protein (multidrug efflux system)
MRTSTSRALARLFRWLLMLGGAALVVAAGLAFWLNGGRYVSIDDAMIRAAKVAVSTDVSGIVAEVAVKEGQAVHKGDVLLRLNDRPFRIALDGAKADMAQALLNIDAMKRDYHRLVHATEAAQAQVQADQASFDRFANLVKGGSVTRAEYDDSRFKLAADQQNVEMLKVQAQVQLARLGGDAEVDATKTPAVQQAQARVDEAQRQLDHTVIKAPFDGIATQVDSVQPGMYLAAATPAFALVSTEHVWAEGNPKETELTNMKPGDKVEMTVDTYPGEVWHGVLETVAPASGSEFSVLPAQNTSGNWVKVVQRIPVRVALERKEGEPELRAGMSVTLSVDTGHVRSLRELY